MFHRRRLALPSSSTLLNSYTLNSSTPLHSSTQNSSTEEESKKEGKKRRTKADTGDEKVEILIRDAFGTFKGEVPYYSARIMSIPDVDVPGLEELDERYEEWFGGEDE